MIRIQIIGALEYNIKMEKEASTDYQALIAYKIIEFVQKIDKATFFKGKQQKRWPYQEQDEQECKMLSIREELLETVPLRIKQDQRSTFNEYAQLFDFDAGFAYNRLLFPQEGIDYASNKAKQEKKIVFNPTFSTAKIFDAIINGDRKAILIGRKGIGKSISIMLLWHLCTIIIAFKMRHQTQLVNSELEELRMIPKIIYHAVSQQESIEELAHKIRIQCSEINFPAQKQEKIKKSLSEQEESSAKESLHLDYLKDLCEHAKNEYSKLGIETVFVLDQADIYYGYIGSLAQINAKKIKEAHQLKELQEKIAIISKYMKIFKNKFKRIIMVSSDELKKDLFPIVETSFPELSVFNINSQAMALRVIIEPGYRLAFEYEQKEMYTIFWFELIRALRQKQIILQKNQQKDLKNRFMRIYCVVPFQPCNDDSQIWTEEKTHSIFRQKLEQIDLSLLIKRIEKWRTVEKLKPKQDSGSDQESDSEYPINHPAILKGKKTRTPFRAELLQLRKQIQYEFGTLKEFYFNFVLQQKNEKKSLARFNFLTMMVGQAHDIVKYGIEVSYLNRYYIEQQHKSQENKMDKDQKQAFYILIAKKYIQLDGKRIIVNHSPKAFKLISNQIMFAFISRMIHFK